MTDIIAVILLSLSFGSFANNVISYFISSNRFDLLRSTCFCGKRELQIKELIPLFSFLLQKGKCKQCTEKISARYPLVETITLMIGLLVYYNFGLTLESQLVFLILYALLMISVIDYFRLIIPNVLTIVLSGLVILLLLINSEPLLHRVGTSVLIAMSLIGLQYLYKSIKGKDVLGMGDIKLIFVLSLLLDITGSLAAIWVSSLAGLIGVTLLNANKIKKLNEIKIPFGLYLSIGFVTVFMWNVKYEINGLERILASIWGLK